MDLDKRLQFYSRGVQFVRDHDADICGFGPGTHPSSPTASTHHYSSSPFNVMTRLGDSGKYGEVYLAKSVYKGKRLEAAMKLMPITYKNKAEVGYYKHFNEYIKSGKNPHYPLVFHSRTCTMCPFHDRPSDACYLVLKEVADGDLKGWLKRKHSNAAYISLWAQLCISGFGLEQTNMIHNDLHWGNVLFHKVNRGNKGKYMYYNIGKFNIYVKFTSEHWVLWDFGLSVSDNPPYDTSLVEDMDRISGMAHWAEKRHSKDPKKYPKPPPMFTDLCKNIQEYLQYLPHNATYIDFLIELERMFEPIDKSILLIDPAKPPSSHRIINPTKPYTIA